MLDPYEIGCPDYDRPPVVETVVGIQFDPLPGLHNAHLGAFWKTLDVRQWPELSDAPTLEPEVERFGGSFNLAQGFRFQVLQNVASRLQIKNNSGDRMIQVQNGRIHFNWIGKNSSEGYPRYSGVRDQFVHYLNEFTRFVKAENIGEIRPNQWEVTYINQIPKGTVWQTPSDWKFFHLLGSLPEQKGLIEGESFSGEWHFEIIDQRGRLHALWKHGITPPEPDGKGMEAVWLTLTARGPLPDTSASGNQILEGLELGHRVVVCSFRNFMSEDANRYWGLK